jgi:hypothetical protein
LIQASLERRCAVRNDIFSPQEIPIDALERAISHSTQDAAARLRIPSKRAGSIRKR